MNRRKPHGMQYVSVQRILLQNMPELIGKLDKIYELYVHRKMYKWNFGNNSKGKF